MPKSPIQKNEKVKIKAWGLIHSDTEKLTYSGFSEEAEHSLLSVSKEKCCVKARQKQIIKRIKTEIVKVEISYSLKKK